MRTLRRLRELILIVPKINSNIFPSWTLTIMHSCTSKWFDTFCSVLAISKLNHDWFFFFEHCLSTIIVAFLVRPFGFVIFMLTCIGAAAAAMLFNLRGKKIELKSNFSPLTLWLYSSSDSCQKRWSMIISGTFIAGNDMQSKRARWATTFGRPRKVVSKWIKCPNGLVIFPELKWSGPWFSPLLLRTLPCRLGQTLLPAKTLFGRVFKKNWYSSKPRFRLCPCIYNTGHLRAALVWADCSSHTLRPQED